MTHFHAAPERRMPIEQEGQGPLRILPFVPPRRRWPGLVAAGLLGAALTAVLVSSLYDERSIGTRLDAGVAAAGSGVQAQVDTLKGAVADAGQGVAQVSEQVTDRVATTVSDAAITASVKAALAADPGLSALQVEVVTEGGVVRLDGPAPNEEARRRAEMLAAAPQGVRSVDNRLVVPAARQ